MLAGGIRRDNGLNAPLLQGFAQASGIVGTIGKQALRSVASLQQAARPLKIMHVASGDQDGMGTPALVGQRMDLGGLAAARAADGVVEGPPFAPAAERCALI